MVLNLADGREPNRVRQRIARTRTLLRLTPVASSAHRRSTLSNAVPTADQSMTTISQIRQLVGLR